MPGQTRRADTGARVERTDPAERSLTADEVAELLGRGISKEILEWVTVCESERHLDISLANTIGTIRERLEAAAGVVQEMLTERIFSGNAFPEEVETWLYAVLRSNSVYQETHNRGGEGDHHWITPAEMIRAAVKISHRSVRKLHQGMGAPLGWGYHNAHKWIFACTDGGYLLLECADESEDNTGRGWSGAGSVTSLSDEDGSRLWKAAEEPKID